MDTPALIPQNPVRQAGSTSGPDTAKANAPTTDFAELLAQELAPPLVSGEIPPEHELPAEDIVDTVTTGDRAAEPTFATDPLASLQLPAVLPAVQTPPAVLNRTGTSATGEVPAEAAAGIDTAPAKSAATGNFPLPAAITGERQPDAAMPDRPSVLQELSAQPVGSWQTTPLPSHSPAAAAAAALPRVEVPVAQPGWSEAFAQRVVLLAGKQQQSAELHLNPPELGPVSIVLSMDNDLANVFFSSPLVPVREAIENAMPTLREALGQAGIQLGETGVSAENFRRETDTRGQGGPAAARGERAGEAAPGNDSARLLLTRHPGLVDTFA